MNENLTRKNDSATISVITATFNAANHLPDLIRSLEAQTDSDFDWIISDGGSTDSTISLLKSIKKINIKITSQDDFGIYDALNRGIKNSKNEYYLVVGADDTLSEDAIEKYKAAASFTKPDFVAAGFSLEGKSYYPKNISGWRRGLPDVASSHSIGLLIKKELHYKIGFYSRSLPICADQLFVLKAIQSGASIQRIQYIAGEYGYEGFSAQDKAGMITELFRSQVLVGRNKAVQIILLFLRILKNYKSL